MTKEKNRENERRRDSFHAILIGQGVGGEYRRPRSKQKKSQKKKKFDDDDEEIDTGKTKNSYVRPARLLPAVCGRLVSGPSEVGGLDQMK